MSDALQHECGLAALRLRKPLSYFHARYGNALHGLEAMYLLLEKQHNRGQDGAGIGAVQLDRPPGEPYYDRERVTEPAPPWETLIQRLNERLNRLLEQQPGLLDDPEALKRHFPYAAELLMGHVRYGTHGTNSVRTCHPAVRTRNWQTRTLLLAGNFNMTNNDRLFERLVELGQHPNERTDTVTILERIGHFLDDAVEGLVRASKAEGIDNPRMSAYVAEQLDLLPVLARAARRWDGGYLLGGMVGSGELFVMRDPHGIRPGYFFADEEIVVAASERQAIATTFNLPNERIQEVPPAHVLLVRRDGSHRLVPFAEAGERRSCTFERIYFSRGNDADIYRERKALGDVLTPRVLAAIDGDLDRSVFSFIPNTAFVAFWGLMKGLEDHLNRLKRDDILALGPSPAPEAVDAVLQHRVRVENLVLKDTKLRTFITDESARDRMAAHVYDITYGAIRPGEDQLVCVDDSIVRGTTLRQSILRMLARLRPRRILIVSSAPQIRYPDCYGIDMSQIERFIAFQAAVSLLRSSGREHVLTEVYERCQELRQSDQLEAENAVKAVYAPFSQEELSAEIGRLLGQDMDCEVGVVYQRVADLHRAIPEHTGDWYFTGDFPTPGGNRVTNQAFLNFYEGTHARAY